MINRNPYVNTLYTLLELARPDAGFSPKTVPHFEENDYRENGGKYSTMALSRLTFLLLATLFPALSLAASSPALGDAERLLQEGQTQAALSQVENHLTSQPKDADARFLKGMILARTGQVDAAIEVFKGLTEDNPELPEPHNNLAVLYAAQGRYEMAWRSLEVAILTHPGYATAHENLGDLHTRLAVQAYEKSLQLDANNPGVQKKVSAIRAVVDPAQASGKAQTAAKTVPLKTATPPVISSPVPPSRALPTATEARMATPEPLRNVETQATPKTDIPAQPLAPESAIKPLATAQAMPMDGAAEARQAIARALDTWAQQQARQGGYSHIELSDLEIDLNGNQATARCLQRYQKNASRGWTLKSFSLTREPTGWQIQQVR